MSQLQPPKCCRNFGGCGGVETPKPGRKRARTCAIEIFEDRQDLYGNRRVTIVSAAHAARWRRCRWQVAGRLPGLGVSLKDSARTVASPPGGGKSGLCARLVAPPRGRASVGRRSACATY